MKNKAYFIKNLARLTGRTEEETQIEYGDKQIVDILLAIRSARENVKVESGSDEAEDLWDRISRAI
jgi:hypothetical protein